MIRGVLFDLDGTLADTAPDLGGALNRLLERYGRERVPLERLRPQASHGARGLLQIGFDIRPGDPYYDELRDEFLELYASNLCVDTTLFAGVPELLKTLEDRDLPWGIVTNKIRRFTEPLVRELELDKRAACVVSGDSYAKPKPYPDPLVGAASEMNLPAETLVYVGDDERDMRAGLAAGMRVVAVRYGYLGSELPPEQWNAHAIVDTPGELLGFIDAVK